MPYVQITMMLRNVLLYRVLRLYLMMKGYQSKQTLFILFLKYHGRTLKKINHKALDHNNFLSLQKIIGIHLGNLGLSHNHNLGIKDGKILMGLMLNIINNIHYPILILHHNSYPNLVRFLNLIKFLKLVNYLKSKSKIKIHNSPYHLQKNKSITFSTTSKSK